MISWASTASRSFDYTSTQRIRPVCYTLSGCIQKRLIAKQRRIICGRPLTLSSKSDENASFCMLSNNYKGTTLEDHLSHKMTVASFYGRELRRVGWGFFGSAYAIGALDLLDLIQASVVFGIWNIIGAEPGIEGLYRHGF
jgi:hypothetical protein